MKGDFSRDNFDPENHYSAVLMQQGRVQLDADWNEQQAIHQYRIETATQDLIGGNGTPGIPPYARGFEITVDSGLGTCDFSIGSGHYYVDGILCENKDKLHYRNQPDFPNADTFTTPGTYLVYLDVWRRHITALDDADIREKALGGPDTTTRIRTIWQVKLQKVDDNVTCSTKLSDWLPKDSSGKLTARALGADYEGLENHLYRVEIHNKGAPGTATFKWSRDNGSVIAAIKTISTSGTSATISVENLALDDVHGFAVNQWVEIINSNSHFGDFTLFPVVGERARSFAT